MHCARRLKLTKRQLKSREKRRLSFKDNNDKAVLGLSIGNNGAQQNGLISLKYRKKITSNLTYTSQKYLTNGKEKQRHVQENRTIETLLPKTQSEISGQQGTLMCSTDVLLESSNPGARGQSGNSKTSALHIFFNFLKVLGQKEMIPDVTYRNTWQSGKHVVI